MKIYNLGSVNIDYVYSVDHMLVGGETLSSEKLEIFPGGKGLNQSVALARAGARVIHGAYLGENGDFLEDTLSSSGVDTSRIIRTDGSCGHAIIQVDKTGQNSILLFPGTNHRMDGSYAKEFLSDAEPGDVLLLQNEISALEEIFEIAHDKQMQIAFNPSPYHESIRKLPLEYVKWWFCNEIEGEALFGSAEAETMAENFAARYPDACLILTLGGEGCVFRCGDRFLRQPACSVKTVDTTAAGDTFTGYFLAAVTAGEEIPAALELATRASAITVSRLGASRSIPYREEVNRFLGNF